MLYLLVAKVRNKCLVVQNQTSLRNNCYTTNHELCCEKHQIYPESSLGEYHKYDALQVKNGYIILKFLIRASHIPYLWLQNHLAP